MLAAVCLVIDNIMESLLDMMHGPFLDSSCYKSDVW